MLRFIPLIFLGLSSLASFAQSTDNPAWTWSPEPRWLTGRGAFCDFYPSFECGLAYGEESSLPFSTSPKATTPVDIVFDKTMSTATRMLRQDEGYADAGVGTFNGAAYDVSDLSAPRRLNVVTIERNVSDKPADGIWNPISIQGNGHDEFLLVMASSYDGDGSTYADRTLQSLDVMYVLIPRVLDGRTLFETSPATLSIRIPPLRGVTALPVAIGSVSVEWVVPSYIGSTTVRIFGDDGELATADGATGSVQIDGLDTSVAHDLRLDLLDSGGAVLSSITTRAQALASGIDAASHLDPIPDPIGNNYGDVWGYTADDGTEYALIAVRAHGLSIIDITAAPASAPVEVGFVPIAPGTNDAKDVKVYDHYAYLVKEYGSIQIIDLDDPSNPTQVGTLDTQPDVPNGGAHNVAVFDGHLWVTGGRGSGNAGVRVYDVRTTPEAPVFVGEFKPTHFYSAYYHDFEVKGDYGFGPNIYGGGVDILDVSDPSNITLISTFSYPGSGVHNTCASEDGNTLYVGDEIGSAGNWTRIFDISDVNNIELVGDIIVDEEAVVHNCYVEGNYLYIAHYTEGLRIFDIQDPHAPTEVAFYDTYFQPRYGFKGAWSVYPYFESGKLIVSDMQSGLFVLTTEASAVSEEATPQAPATRLTVAPNPTRSQATLTLQLDEPALVRLSVFDVRGRELRVLVDETVGTERQRVDLDTSSLAPGAYVVRLAVEGEAPISQMLTVVR